jgi:diguanylate cyclase (GGDEF)-like protein
VRLPRNNAWVFLLLVSSAAGAQEYSLRTYGNTEGLADLAVRQIYQDHIGFLWVSTEDGIYRFDGERFQAFGVSRGVPANSAVAFGEAPDGSLLAGGDIGLYRLRDNRFQAVPGPFKSVNWAQGIRSGNNGRTYIGTDAGLAEITIEPGTRDRLNIRMLPRPPAASGPGAWGVLADGNTLWYGCGMELCHIHDGTTTVIGRESGLPARQVTSILKDGEGSLWVRVRYEGVFVRPAGHARFEKPHLPIPESSTIGVPSLDRDGHILLPTPEGLLIQEPKGWKVLDAAHGLHGIVYAALEDGHHSLWIGTAGRGMVQWRGYGEWDSYSETSGLANDIIYEIARRSGTIWLGTEGGLLRGQFGSSGIGWSQVPALAGLGTHTVQFAPAPSDTVLSDTLWIGTETRGVANLDTRTGRLTWINKAQGLTAQSVYTLRFDREKRLWVGTETGLFLSNPPYRTFDRVRDVPASRIWDIAQTTDGTIWAGGLDGLFALSNGKWLRFDRSSGLSNQEVLSLGAAPDGALWIGYHFGGGIDRARLHSTNLTIEKGVQRPGNEGLVYFFGFDTLGQLWIGTEHGVNVLNGSHWRNYDADDGLAWNDCNLHSFAADPDGTIWIGTSAGLSRFKPQPRSGPQAGLHVVFTRLKMGRVDVFGKTRTSPKADSLIATFAAPNASRSEGVVYRYRLTDRAGWSETTQPTLQFAKLAPGSYRLEVQARETDGPWSSDTAQFAFSIPYPWYESWWFLSICVLVPTGLGWLVVRVRMARLEHEKREFEKLKAAHEEIRNLAYYDPLTALPNRRHLLHRLNNSLELASADALCALLFIDLDNFKNINDTLGHKAGDRMLMEAARQLTTCLRENGTAGRWGGDEFIVFIDDLNGGTEKAAAHVESQAMRILSALSQPHHLGGREYLTACSIGITIFGKDSPTADVVLQQAELAMYQAKNAGRNTIRFFAPELQSAMNERAALEADLRLAIKSDQFVLFFQPLISHGLPIGAEALIRWQHPVRGLLQPIEFIPFAEQSGLILSIGDWVLESACRRLASWAAAPLTAELTLSINVSARQFAQPDFADHVISALDRTGARPEHLKIELTETSVVENADDVISKMMQLRECGLRFSLDDFGTGYSSLRYLQRLPIDELKIDRSFVTDIQNNPVSAAIAQATISLARAKEVAVLAEGVETDGQRRFLEQQGCFDFQGFLFSRPLPLDVFHRYLLGFPAILPRQDRRTRTIAGGDPSPFHEPFNESSLLKS